MLFFDTPQIGGAVGGILLLGITEAIFNPVWVFIISGELSGILSLRVGVLVLASIAVWAIRSQKRVNSR